MFAQILTPDARMNRVRSGRASPYTFRWVLANQRGQGVATVGAVDWVSGRAQSFIGADGARIHDGTSRLAQNTPIGKWHHVSVEVDAEVFTPLDEAPLNPTQIRQQGNRSSLLKARIEVALGTARIRTFDFDIGSGVDLDVAAHAINWIEVLVPDPAEDARPPSDPQPVGAALGERKIESVLTTTAYFTTGSPAQRQPLTYTVPVYLSNGNQETIMYLPRVSASIEVELVTDEQQAAADGIIVDFIYVPNVLPAATYIQPSSYFILSSVGLPRNSHRIPRTSIPDGCNAFRVSRLFGSDDTSSSLIQILNV